MMRFGRLPSVLTLGLLVIVAMQGGAVAQPAAQDAFLDSLVGTWSGSGEMAGHPISHSYAWEWSLGHQFLFGEHHGTITIEGRSQSVEVHFYLHPNGDGTYTGVSVSSEGAIRNMTGSLSDEGAFVTDDRREDGSTSRLVAAVSGDTLTITILVGDAAGAWEEIGSTTLTRQ